MLTIENDWEKLTYKWNGETVETIEMVCIELVAGFGDKSFQARMTPVTRYYMDSGHSYSVNTHVLEVYISSIDQWVELEKAERVTGVHNGERWLT